MTVDFHTKWVVVDTTPKVQRSTKLWSSKCPVCLKSERNRSKHTLMNTDCCASCSHKSHGRCYDRIYKQLSEARKRCNNPNHARYKDYGGRGISVCPQWQDFTVFLADMGECPDGYQLDRIDNNGNYEPGNCRWVTAKDNANNRRNNVKVSINNELKTVSQIAQDTGLSISAVYRRIKLGDIGDQLIRPPRNRRHNG